MYIFIRVCNILTENMSKFKGVLLALLITIILVLIDSLVLEPNIYVINEIKIGVPEIDERLSGLTIVQISDLHLQGFGLREEWVIKAVNGLSADLIVVTGDLIDKREMIDYAIEFVKRLKAKIGVFIVFGNWDYWSGVNMTEFRAKLRRTGAIVLVNEHVEVEFNNTSFYLIGVDDPHTGHDDLEKAMPKTDSKLKILLAHSPEIIDKAVNVGVHLVLCGHTHGGQVVIPLVGPLFLPVRREYRKYSSGLFKVNETYLYVNRGLGTSMLPVRFLCPPEITVIRIFKKS